jgi:hypothetical protein
VYGSPESGFRTVVTTLLADPLTQSDEARKAILDRANEEIGETFVTRLVTFPPAAEAIPLYLAHVSQIHSYGDSVGRDVNGLVVDSPWLRDAAVDVHEVTSKPAIRPSWTSPRTARLCCRFSLYDSSRCFSCSIYPT